MIENIALILLLLFLTIMFVFLATIDQPELGLGPRLITKIGLHTHVPTTHHPPIHLPPQTFLHEGEVLGVPNLVCNLHEHR